MKTFKKLLKLTLVLQIIFVQNVYAQNTSIRSCSEEDRVKKAQMEAELVKSNAQLIEAQNLLNIEKSKGKYVVNRYSDGVEQLGATAAAIGIVAAFIARSNEGFMGSMRLFGLGAIIAASGAFMTWITNDPETKLSIDVLEKQNEKFAENSQLLKIQLRELCQ